MLRVIDAAHLLPDGDVPAAESPARAQALTAARLIEYGGPLAAGECCFSLVECRQRTGRRPCRDFLRVGKEPGGRIVASCPSCEEVRYVISNWGFTLWADGPMVMPAPQDAGVH
jgi:hypothetical protein